MTIKELCLKYQKDPEFIKTLNSIKDTNSYRLAKKQEDLFVKNSNGFLDRLNNEYFNNKQFDPELDLKFGDFKDAYGNYYDLKVGLTDLCGSIDFRSLKYFGDTSTDKHFYLCVNKDLSRYHIINARILKERIENRYNKSLDEFIEEKEKGSKFTHIGELIYRELI